MASRGYKNDLLSPVDNRAQIPYDQGNLSPRFLLTVRPRTTLAEENEEDQDELICEACDPEDVTPDQVLHFCYACDFVFCERCWKSQLPHRKNRQATSGVVHEKTNPWIAKKVQSALSPPVDERTYAKLCMQDEHTSWFGRSNMSLLALHCLAHVSAQVLTAKTARVSRSYFTTLVGMPNLCPRRKINSARIVFHGTRNGARRPCATLERLPWCHS